MKSAASVRQGIIDRARLNLLYRLDQIASDLIELGGTTISYIDPTDQPFMLKELEDSGFKVEKLDDYTFRITV